jgi:hypothetical protein
MIDWAQGDRVCTDCGVVDEQQLLDDRPEWRDFQDADDLVKGLPSGARSGLVAVDEAKYVGGLQPTGLSKRPFGNPIMGRGGKSAAVIRKSLNTTNRKMDYMMEKQQSKALKRARLSRLIKKKQIVVEEGGDDDIQPEHDQLLVQEEEDAQRVHATLYAEKWSLERAFLLCGTDLEQRSQSHGLFNSATGCAAAQVTTTREQRCSKYTLSVRMSQRWFDGTGSIQSTDKDGKRRSDGEAARLQQTKANVIVSFGVIVFGRSQAWTSTIVTRSVCNFSVDTAHQR